MAYQWEHYQHLRRLSWPMAISHSKMHSWRIDLAWRISCFCSNTRKEMFVIIWCINKTLRLVGLEKWNEEKISHKRRSIKERPGLLWSFARSAILVLDEPTSGLDPATEQKVMNISDEFQNQNKTVICSKITSGKTWSFWQGFGFSRGILFFGIPSELLEYFKIDHHTRV